MIGLDQLQARHDRLAAILAGMNREAVLFAEAETRLDWRERKAYLDAVAAACKALGDARLTLALACQRIREQDGVEPGEERRP